MRNVEGFRGGLDRGRHSLRKYRGRLFGQSDGKDFPDEREKLGDWQN